VKRRRFITLLGGAGAFPFIAHAQQSDRMRRIGALMGIAENDVDAKVRAVAFQQRLHELGWTEGRNVSIEYRWAAADQERMAAYAAELVAFAPDLILANTTPVVVALKKATSTIPIVFVMSLTRSAARNGVCEGLSLPARFFPTVEHGRNLHRLQNFAPISGGQERIPPYLSQLILRSLRGRKCHTATHDVGP
jgi:hypothetical protein